MCANMQLDKTPVRSLQDPTATSGIQKGCWKTLGQKKGLSERQWSLDSGHAFLACSTCPGQGKKGQCLLPELVPLSVLTAYFTT